MIYEHIFGNLTKHEDSTVTVAFNFVNDLATGETVSSSTITMVDESAVDVTATMINSTSEATPIVYVTLTGGTANKSYEIKIIALTSAAHSITRFIVLDVIGNVEFNPKLGDSKANSYVSMQEANEYIKSNFYHPDQWDNLTFEGRKRALIQAVKDIDTFNFRDKPFYDTQALAFPRSDHETFTGNASANTATTGTMRGLNLYSSTYNVIPDDYFRYGAVHIKAGNNSRQIRYVSSSTASQTGGYGEVVLSSPFDSNVVASDQYILFTTIQQDIKDAQCEQAMFIIADEYYKYPDQMHAGIGYIRTGDLGVSFKDTQRGVTDSKVCVKARRLLGRYMRKTMKIGRA